MWHQDTRRLQTVNASSCCRQEIVPKTFKLFFQSCIASRTRKLSIYLIHYFFFPSQLPKLIFILFKFLKVGQRNMRLSWCKLVCSIPHGVWGDLVYFLFLLHLFDVLPLYSCLIKAKPLVTNCLFAKLTFIWPCLWPADEWSVKRSLSFQLCFCLHQLIKYLVV